MFALARLVLALFTSILLNASDVLFWALQHQADQLLREGRYEEAMPVVRALSRKLVCRVASGFQRQ